jgi:hypothetical protein
VYERRFAIAPESSFTTRSGSLAARRSSSPARRAVAVAVEPGVTVRAVDLERALRPEEVEPLSLGDERGEVGHD